MQHEKLRRSGKIAHERIQPALAEIAEVCPEARLNGVWADRVFLTQGREEGTRRALRL